MNNKGIYRLIFLFFSCLLFAVYCLLSSCGKRGEPTLKSYEKPAPPSNLKAIHRESEIILTWEFPKGREQSIEGFYLMKSTNSSFKRISFVENDKRSFTDTDFKTGFEYKYKIISRSLKGILSIDSNIVLVKPEPPPAPPQNLSFTIEYNSLTIRWNSAGDKVFYNIYRSDKQGFYTLTPVNKEPVKETLFRDTLDITKPVYYTVRSLREGDIRDEGTASEEITIDPSEFIPSRPETLRAVATKEKVYLVWKEPPQTWIRGYRVYRETNKKEGFILIGETEIPSFIDNTAPSTKRNYRVTALGPSKEGTPAEINNVVYKKPR